MGLRHALIVAVALLAPSPAPALPEVGCGGCHAGHHETVGPCAACHRGDTRSRRPEIAHRDLIPARFSHFGVPGSPMVASGRRRIDLAGCRRCHVTGGRGDGLATDLDRLLPGGLPGEALAAIQQPALFMPRFAFPEQAAVEVVNALLAGSAGAPPRVGEAPLVVHFERARPEAQPFDRHCGGCHRMLTRARGGLGRGATGPNLSGLFGQFYPATFKEGERWSPANLKPWVANPRQFRPVAVMPPQPLTAQEWEGVLSAFEVADAPPGGAAAGGR